MPWFRKIKAWRSSTRLFGLFALRRKCVPIRRRHTQLADWTSRGRSRRLLVALHGFKRESLAERISCE